jgi:tRNA(Ile)-lysidine synthase
VTDVAALLARCTFPPPGTPVVCGHSGGPDSAALVALAVAAGCAVTARHVHHDLRLDADRDAELARRSAHHLGATFELVRISVAAGPNLEARARDARHAALGPGALTGHTADDQAETLLLALLRGAGAHGLAAMEPGHRHPILALRSAETRALCATLELDVAADPTNTDPRFRRNRIRHELVPLLDDVAERDVTILLNRTADLLRADDELLEELSRAIDPTDVDQLNRAPGPLAARAVRRWLEHGGYPPDAAAVSRVLAVAGGASIACEVVGGIRIERRRNRLVRTPTALEWRAVMATPPFRQRFRAGS